MTGVVVQINISRGGVPKRAISSAVITPLGVEGDGWAHPQIHGGPQKALLLMASEDIEELRSLGYPVFHGALGENLTTRGLDFRQLRVGYVLQVGQVVIEVTKVRAPCSTLAVYGESLAREIYDSQVKVGDPASPKWGTSGFYASVIRPGPIHPDDIITLLAAAA